MIVSCGVVSCTKFPERSVIRRINGSNNYVNHYARHHPELPRSQAEVDFKKKNPKGDFFATRKRVQDKVNVAIADRDQKLFRRLLINFIVKNNLSFRVVEQ